MYQDALNTILASISFAPVISFIIAIGTAIIGVRFVSGLLDSVKNHASGVVDDDYEYDYDKKERDDD